MEPKIIVAVDAVGTTAAAGPITAAAVIYTVNDAEPSYTYRDGRGRIRCRPLLRDISGIPAPLLEHIRTHVKQTCVAWAVVHRTASIVHDIGPAQAAAEAMGVAVVRSTERLVHTRNNLLEGLRRPEVHVHIGSKYLLSNALVHEDLPQTLRVAGWRIGAARLLAIAAREAEMKRIAERFPQYAFERNQGRMTPELKRFTKRFGTTPEHRRAP